MAAAHLRHAVAAALAAAALLAGAACGDSDRPEAAPLGTTGSAPAEFTVRVVAEHPHDDEAFTQGLVWAGDGELFESTGRRGRSSVRRVAVATGEVLERRDLDPEYFGEGLAQVGDELVQLTWQEETAFRYDAGDLAPVGTFSYEGEGWGLCHDGERLVMSDGSDVLVFRDPDSFDELGDVEVVGEGEAVSGLNELECVGDRVYANVLGSDTIYEIDPATGAVTATVDASSLAPDQNRVGGEVLNGIAYDPDGGRWFLTGKNWPTLFEVAFEPVG